MKKFCLVLLLIALSVSCGKDIVKPSDDSRAATDAVATIEIIKNAYELKNKDTLQNHVESEQFDRITSSMFFDRAELTFTTRLIKITDAAVLVDVNWQGSWWIGSSSKLDNRGTATFVLDNTANKLKNITGDSPFMIPVAR